MLVRIINRRNKISSAINRKINSFFSYLDGIDEFILAKEHGEKLNKEEMKALTFMLDSLSSYDVFSISDLNDSLKNLNDAIKLLNDEPGNYSKYIAIIITDTDLFKKYGAMDSYHDIYEGHMSVLATKEKLINRINVLIKETEKAIKAS